MAEKDFKDALKYVTSLPKSGGGKDLSNNTKLAFYSLFKQISEGPCKGKAPSRLNMVAYAKYDAWKKLGNMSKEDAMKKYVEALSKEDADWRTKLNNNTQIRSKL